MIWRFLWEGVNAQMSAISVLFLQLNSNRYSERGDGAASDTGMGPCRKRFPGRSFGRWSAHGERAKRYAPSRPVTRADLPTSTARSRTRARASPGAADLLQFSPTHLRRRTGPASESQSIHISASHAATATAASLYLSRTTKLSAVPDFHLS